jgi:hypothetical protein
MRLSKSTLRSRQENDCAVIAIADYFKKGYGDILALCTTFGRRKNEGMAFDGFLQVVHYITGEKPTINPSNGENIRVVDVIREGKFKGFIICYDHVMCVHPDVPMYNPRGMYDHALVMATVTV